MTNTSIIRVGVVCAAAAALLVGCIEEPEVAEAGAALVAAPGDVDDVPGCPGSWSYIRSFAGFAGTYSRFDVAADGELARVSILGVTPDPDTIFVTGGYRRAVRAGVWFVEQAGQYMAVPVNPAIGSHLVFLDASGDTIRDGYVIIGARRSAFTSRIDQLCLARWDDASENGAAEPFALYRWF